MPPRGYKEMVAERSARKPRTKTATTTRTKAPAASDPREMEMSARAARLGRGRQVPGAAPGGSRTGGNGLFTIQDMENDPAVGWSRGMARGPAQGKVDSITNDVHSKLAEQGITRDDTGTWGIDFAANTAYRNARRGSSGLPSGPAATIPSGGGFPGPAKPPGPNPSSGGTLPRQPTGGSLPPGTIPKQPTTGGTIPRQTSVYEPAKPAPSTTLGLPPAGISGGHNAQTLGLPPAGSAGNLNQTTPAAKPPQPSLPVIQGPQETAKPAMDPRAAATGNTLGVPSFTQQPAGKPPAPTPSSLPNAVQPAPGVIPRPMPVDPSVTQLPTLGAGPQQFSGYAHPDAAVTQRLGGTPGTLPRQGGSTPAPVPAPSGRPQPPGMESVTVTAPPGQAPQQPRQSQIPTRGANGVPQMPQSGGSNNALGGDIQAQVAAMISGIQGQVSGQVGRAGMPQRGQGLAGLEGLGDRISQGVQQRVGAIGKNGQSGLPQAGGTNGLAGLGERIQAGVQSRIGAIGKNGQAPVGPQTGQIPAGPQTGQVPGGGRVVQPAPGGTLPAQPGGGTIPQQPPTGSGGTLGSYGNPSIDQWDSAFIAAGNKYGVDPTILKAMAEIESGGNGDIPLSQCRDDGYGEGESCGLMQVKGDIHGHAGSTEEQIMIAARILADYKAANPGATDRDALFGAYFTGVDPNGTTPGSYGEKVTTLMGQMGPYQPSTDPEVSTLPTTGTGGSLPIQPGGQTSNIPQAPSGQAVVDPQYIPSGRVGPHGGPANTEPVSQLTVESLGWAETFQPGAAQSAVNNQYGYKENSACPGCYDDYYSWDPDEHTGLDIPGAGGSEYNSVVSGEVVCTGASGDPGTGVSGCGAYGDEGGGLGNLSIRTPSGAVVTYGHTRSGYFGLGETVQAGQPIGTVGTANGDHIHLEVSLPVGPGGQYVMVDPNLYMNGYYCQQGFCPE